MRVAKLLVIGVGVVFGLSLAGLGVMLATGRGPSEARSGDAALPAALRPSERVKDLRVPEFSLTNQDGAAIDQELLRGRVTIVDFIFTNCPFACPVLTAGMARASQELKGTGARFLSISVDPQRDTPETLKAYAARNNADTTRWTFATGPMSTVLDIASTHLKFHVGDDPKTSITLPDGSKMNNIAHPAFFVLVGPDLRVLDIYRSSERAQVDELIARAREASGILDKAR